MNKVSASLLDFHKINFPYRIIGGMIVRNIVIIRYRTAEQLCHILFFSFVQGYATRSIW